MATSAAISEVLTNSGYQLDFTYPDERDPDTGYHQPATDVWTNARHDDVLIYVDSGEFWEIQREVPIDNDDGPTCPHPVDTGVGASHLLLAIVVLKRSLQAG